MLATAPTGFMHLNAANNWPSFTLQDMAIDPSGALVLSASGGTYASAGAFVGGPFQALDGETPWYRFTLAAKSVPGGTHLQVFTWTADQGPAAVFLSSDTPFPGWHAAPRDALQGVIFNAPKRYLWIGGVVRSDGTATPSIPQIRIDYGRDTYLKYLPAIYRADPASSDLLQRLLSLSQTALGGLGQEIIDLTRLFDPAATPEQGYPSWFAWLAGWLAWQLEQNWTDEEARAYLAEAFRLYALRGTVEGLRRYLKIYAGVNAFISEPALDTTIWSLGTNSVLGATTMLAPASASGAILDTTAVLDQSNLVGPDDAFGSALFGDVAYRFCVTINAGELTRPGALAAVRAVIAREKPAHTVCELNIVEPRMRVGVQCRIGIDSVIGAPREAQLGARLDQVVLAASDRECNESEVRHAS
ncbi:MAG TPA: phage tail protein [Xanthobacteraceae bacterium]|nr:phage tail protein [Xanthobacteraceae bacterium]